MDGLLRMFEVIASVVRTVEDDWMKPKTKEERENMMGKAGVARTIITCGFLMMATTVAVLVVFPCVGLTIRYTTNLTDPGRILPMQTYYVYDVDRSPVFEVLFLGQAVCLILGAFASTGIDNFFGLLVFHAIAQFENLERRLTDLRNGQHFDLELSFCVKEHVRLIRFVQVIESTFHLMLLGLLSYFAVVFCLQGFLIISKITSGCRTNSKTSGSSTPMIAGNTVSLDVPNDIRSYVVPSNFGQTDFLYGTSRVILQNYTMEKFAVDLDKVLDDFEFNEDCAEQIASINSPASNSTLLTDTHINDSVSSKLQTIEGGRPSQGFEISPFEKHEYNKTVKYEGRSLSEKHEAHDSVGYCEGNLASKRADPVNYFYPENYASDAGVSQMQCVYLQAPAREQIPVSTSNDISQTVLAKQHNESNSQHIQNRYDKKLNQPNIKPSVSNVFNSLNEYINAPTISLDYAENMLDKEESGPSEQSNAQDDECRISTSEVTIVDYQLSSNIAPIANDDDDDDDDDDDEAVKSEVTHGTIFTEQSIILPEHQGASFEGKEHRNKYDVIPSTSTQESKCAVESDSVNVDGSQAEKLYLKISNLDINSDGVERTNVVGSEVADLQHECTNVDTNDTVLKLTTESSAKANVIDEFRAPENIQLEVQDENASRNASQQVSSLSTSDTWTSRRKPIGFNDIDDLSEEELNTYLNKLEAEEESKGSNISNRYVLTESHGEVVNNSSEDAGSKLQLHSEKGKENITMDDKTRRESTASTREKDSEEKREEYLNVKPKLDDEEAINDEASNDILKDRQWVMSNDEKVKIEEKKEQAANEEIKDAVDKLRYEVAISSKDTTVVESRLPFDESRTLKMRNDEADVSQELSRSAKTEVLRAKEVNENKVLISEQNNNQVCEERVLGNLAYDIEDKHRKLRGNRTVDAPTNNTEIDKENVSKQNEIGKEGEKPIRPQTLDIGLTVTMDERRVPESSSVSTTAEINAMELEGSGDASRESADTLENSLMESTKVLGRQPPFWVPDSDAASCMLCDIKFTVLKRRHHCRACGKVLCKKCCSMKYKLQYQGNIDSRVCVPCYVLLMKADNGHGMNNWSSNYTNSSEINSPQGRPPNPNNPMEYCSTIPPLQQLAGGLPPPPTVMVPVGVLKREGSTKQRSEGSKSVMFSDELDTSWDMHLPFRKPGSKRVLLLESPLRTNAAKRQNLLPLDLTTNSYIPQDPNLLPPTVTIHKGQASYHNATDQDLLYKTLKNECEPPVMFAINRNLYAYVKITNLNCCVNRICWNVTSKGLACVGQDEVILLVEALPDETQIPKDLLLYVNQIYVEATKGNTMTELSVSIHQGGNLLGSREHAGFLFIRQTLQCLQKIILPPAPFLIGLLIHRWETPWAKVFPLRLLLRLGAEYRYYPCPLVSVRFRDALYFEIGHTVMKVLADFRNFGYTLPGVRGLVIHLKNRTTDVMFPRNRYDQVIKGLNNSNDHVLAYASNFSIIADSHLVCIQTNTGDESSYQTQAINIQNKPRTVTGASFIVINGALKSSMGLSAKSSIVEDGLMVEIMPEKMEALKAALKNMQDFSIGCGRQGAAEPDETVHIKWVENDLQFNLGVKSPIDGQLMDGIPSIRVHNATDYKGTSRFIRWTEVFIIKSDDHPNGVHDPMDINKLSESIARATSIALVKLLDLLATAGLTKLGVRTTIHTDNVGYEAGSEGVKLPPIYMNSLDNELIQILHKAAQSSQDTHTVLELIFYILDD